MLAEEEHVFEYVFKKFNQEILDELHQWASSINQQSGTQDRVTLKFCTETFRPLVSTNNKSLLTFCILKWEKSDA